LNWYWQKQELHACSLASWLVQSSSNAEAWNGAFENWLQFLK